MGTTIDAAHNVVIDIAATFQAIYGYLPANVPPMPAAPNNVNPYQVNGTSAIKKQTAMGSPLYGLSDMIGREVFMPITITSGGVDYNFPFGVIGIKVRKILKETPMVERGGDVIEEIATGALEFDFKGFLIDAADQFPDDQLAAVKTLFYTNAPVYLKCALTDLFMPAGDQVVIKELDIPAKAKVIGVKEIAFTMKQDSILDLYAVV